MGGLEVQPEQEGEDLEENSSCHWCCEPPGYKPMVWGTLAASPGTPTPPGTTVSFCPADHRREDHRRPSPGTGRETGDVKLR